MAKTKQNNRVFSQEDMNGNTRTFRVIKPSQEVITKASFEMSSAFTEALLEANLPTKNRMLNKLKENGVWTKEDELKLSTARDRYIKIRKKVDKKAWADDAEKEAIEKEESEALDEYNKYNSEIEGMLSHTCEAKGEEAQETFILVCTIEEGELTDDNFVSKGNVWGSVEAYQSDEDSTLKQRCYHEWTSFDNGVDSKWEEYYGKISKEDSDDPDEETTEGETPEHN